MKLNLKIELIMLERTAEVHTAAVELDLSAFDYAEVQAAEEPITKRCKACFEYKKLDEFYKNASSKYGVFNECKICISKKNRKKYRENKRNVAEDGATQQENLITRIKDIKIERKTNDEERRTKQCNTCFEYKKLLDFSKGAFSKDGRVNKCQRCVRNDFKQYEIKDGAEIKVAKEEKRETKRCRICSVTKPLDHFSLAGGRKDGHRNECKECVNEDKKKKYLGRKKGGL